ncbi:MAG: hypothetical protein HW421_2001 [Ignavibacteria bacterium]|nr:hypothetical protein [Ignavibacteria bacterium]
MLKFFQKLGKHFKKSEEEISADSVFLKEKFKNFQALLDFNDEVLKLMSEFSEKLTAEGPITIGYGERISNDIIDKTRGIVNQLKLMRNGHFAPLLKKIDIIEEQLIDILSPAFYCPERWDCPEQSCNTCEKKHYISQNIPYTLDINEITNSDIIGVGKKMSRLGELKHKLNINIPEAFVLTSRCFDDIFNYADVRSQISTIIKAIDFQDISVVQKASQELQALLINTNIPEEIELEIFAAYDNFIARNPHIKFLAIRSSAMGEDSMLHSFAGLHHTALNVGKENFINACWEVLLSKYDPQSLVYRFINGFRDKDMPMSIGCMEMLNPSVSGVIFTNDPLRKNEGIIIQAARGVGALIVDGRISPQQFIVNRDELHNILSFKQGNQSIALQTRLNDGLAEVAIPPEISQTPCLTPEQIVELAKIAMSIENYFGSTQDIEWAIDNNGKIFILQARPLFVFNNKTTSEDFKFIRDDFKLIAEGGDAACSGIISGEVFVANRLQDLVNFPEGGILVTSHVTASYTRILHKASAVVANIGSTTGHFALIAREFRIPTILNMTKATSNLSTGMKIIVDAVNCKIYEGESDELKTINFINTKDNHFKISPVYKVLERLGKLIFPLNLTDPTESSFRPEGCITLHDITRYTHEIAIKEMFNFFEVDKLNQKMVKRLIFTVPLNLYIVDLGGGIKHAVNSPAIKPTDIISIPFRALIEGMTSPGVKWSGPMPVDFKGLTHLLMASVVDSTRSEGEIGSSSYAFISEVYVNFSSRLGYHFTRLDAYSSDEINNNYITFNFKGGAADTLRRTRRAKFIAIVLDKLGFNVLQKEDLVHASIRKLNSELINERLIVMGRLMGAVRNIDVTMVSDYTIEKFAKAFLNGNNTPAIDQNIN